MIIKIGEKIIEIQSMHTVVERMCKNYLYKGAEAPAFRVVISQEDIDRDRKASERLDAVDGRITANISDADIETMSVLRKTIDQMIFDDFIMFHSSAVEIGGKGYAFSAVSGTGKSTFSRNLQSILGDKMRYINDDKPFIQFKNDEARIYGTPWDGKHHLSNNTSAPLEAIFFLERSNEPWIAEVKPNEVFKDILQQVYKPDRMDRMLKVMDTLNAISRNVKFYRMGITLDTRTAELFVEELL